MRNGKRTHVLGCEVVGVSKKVVGGQPDKITNLDVDGAAVFVDLNSLSEQGLHENVSSSEAHGVALRQKLFGVVIAWVAKVKGKTCVETRRPRKGKCQWKRVERS